MNAFKVGDTVAWSRAYLKGARLPWWHEMQRGCVVEIVRLPATARAARYVRVQWLPGSQEAGQGEAAPVILASNLRPASPDRLA
jgi:hypothetical protein